MKIIGKYDIVKNRNNEWWTNITATSNWEQITDLKQVKALHKIQLYAKRKTDNNVLQSLVNDYITEYTTQSTTSNSCNNDFVLDITTNVKTTISNLIDFFKDFEFEPNFRFINTLLHHSINKTEVKNYIVNYFNLTDSIYKTDIQEKLKSYEAKQIIDDMIHLKSISNKERINRRFKIYYGSQGTGKTTKAMNETSGIVIGCHSGMLPNDLLEDFKFENGQPTFKKSALWLAMENGTSITLDEINLLPFDSLRFLQTILDNKQQIEYKGQLIKIKDGFEIIGTMNLIVNGATFNLPEPLVDRAYDIKEFKLTADLLLSAVL